MRLEQQMQGYIKVTDDTFKCKISTSVWEPRKKRKDALINLGNVAVDISQTVLTERPIQKAVMPNVLSGIVVALPGSFLNIVHKLKFKSLMIGQIAGFFANFSVGEIVIFDDNAIGTIESDPLPENAI